MHHIMVILLDMLPYIIMAVSYIMYKEPLIPQHTVCVHGYVYI